MVVTQHGHAYVTEGGPSREPSPRGSHGDPQTGLPSTADDDDDGDDDDDDDDAANMELCRMPVCRECLALLRPPRRGPPAPRRLHAWAPTTISRRGISARAHNERVRATRAVAPKPVVREQSVRVLESLLVAARSAHTMSSQDLDALHTRIRQLGESTLKPEHGQRVPDEARVLDVLEDLTDLARSLVDGKHPTASPPAEAAPSAPSPPPASATSALLGAVTAPSSYPAFISSASLLNLVSETAEQILRAPHVFITPAILKTYVHLQALLHQPASLPDIFDLYARKPIPEATATGIKYTEPNPKQVSAAIDPTPANAALDSAIAAHNLPLALDIIATTFSAPAFLRARILRQGILPLSAAAILPLAAYTLSSQYALYFQSTMSPSYATGIAFAGTMAYVLHVSTIGYVAVTTANDQMERVTWAQGVPLWERWVREEERAALDRVACAWGFEGREKRGEEQGREWEGLKEWVGARGMVLDRVELMEGME